MAAPLWQGKSLWCWHCFASQIATAEAETAISKYTEVGGLMSYGANLADAYRLAGIYGVAAFVQRLRELGWIEGRTVAIKVRWAEGRSERTGEIVTEFVREKVDVIVLGGTVSVLAANQGTSVIPIVLAGAGDPVSTGFVVSLARPGGNGTGLSLRQSDLAGKRLELLREVVPALRRLAILANAGNPVTLLDMREVEAAAGPLGLTVVTVEIRRMEDNALKPRATKGDLVTG